MDGKVKFLSALAILLVAGGVGLRADTFTFTQANSSSGWGTGGFGEVTLTLNGNSIDVVVTMTNPYAIVATQGGYTGFGWNSTDNLSITNLSSMWYNLSNPAMAQGDYVFNNAPGAYQFDGFGDFSYRVQGPSPSTGGWTQLSFNVARSGGFSSASQLVNLNSQGVPFVVDVRNNFDCGAASQPGCTTGFVVPQVPEPGFYGSLLLGMGGLLPFAFRRRRA